MYSSRPPKYNHGAAMEWFQLSSALQTGEDPEAAVNLIFIINISNNVDGILRSVCSACDAAYARDN